MDLDLSGRRAVVTGASTGIGAATVRALAAHGADVAFCARRREGVESFARELTGLPGRLHPFTADMSDSDSATAFCTDADEALGGCDILVNNVGAPSPTDFLHATDGEWEGLLNVNLLSAVRCTRHFLPGMRAQRSGRVIMIGTTLAKYPYGAVAGYAASKAALAATTKALAREYGADGVLINTVLPGRIRTPGWDKAAGGDAEAVIADRSAAIPLGRFGDAAEIGNVVLFLASDLSSYVNGAAIDVDGGLATHVY